MLKIFIIRLALVLPLLLAEVSLAGPHKLRVTDPALAKSLVAQGGRVLADYQSFQLIEVDELPAAKILSGGRIQLVDRFDSIQLNARSLDTRATKVRSALAKTAATFSGRRLQLALSEAQRLAVVGM